MLSKYLGPFLRFPRGIIGTREVQSILGLTQVGVHNAVQRGRLRIVYRLTGPGNRTLNGYRLTGVLAEKARRDRLASLVPASRAGDILGASPHELDVLVGQGHVPIAERDHDRSYFDADELNRVKRSRKFMQAMDALRSRRRAR